MNRPVCHDHMQILGYCTPWDVTAGGRVALSLSTAEEVDQVVVRRLDMPEMATETWPIEWLDGGRTDKSVPLGSSFHIPKAEFAAFGILRKLEFEVLLTVNTGRRVIVECGASTLGVEDGRIFLIASGKEEEMGVAVPSQTWLRVSLEAGGRALEISITGCDRLAPYHSAMTVAADADALDGDIRFATDAEGRCPSLNARFARPQIVAGEHNSAWNFPTRFTTEPIISRDGEAKLYVVNYPTFCVRSPRWDGSSYEPRLVPEQYDAIHFHEDDAGPFDWQPSLQLDVPENASSGIYAFEVTAGAACERIEFFVTARRPAADLLFVVPTATYLAYANETLPEHLYPWKCVDRGHLAARDNGLRSLYDYHFDESGVSITSSLKPKTTLRTDYRYPLCGCPHNLPVDLRLLHFCRLNGIGIDITTDHAIHRNGADALAGYRCVVTGSHPEYLSVEMEAAYRQHVEKGNHLAYLGGNGFASVVGFHEDAMELRRSPLEANRTWDGAIAEQALATTNEPGGPLRARGRGEFSLLGVAMSLMGFDRALPYRRTPASYEPKYAWLFSGVDQAEFGTEGAVLGGVAGYEVDATDPHLGTRRDTVVLAEAHDFSSEYVADPARWYSGGETERRARSCAEMTLRSLPSGAMIFSASSVAWCGALPTDGSLNAVGRITRNLLRHLSKRDLVAP